MLRAAHVHVRARLPRRGGAAGARAASSASLRGLFDWYCEHPDELPAGGRRTPRSAERVIDYIAGMTDRFAIRAWTERAVPQGFAA